MVTVTRSMSRRACLDRSAGSGIFGVWKSRGRRALNGDTGVRARFIDGGPKRGLGTPFCSSSGARLGVRVLRGVVSSGPLRTGKAVVSEAPHFCRFLPVSVISPSGWREIQLASLLTKSRPSESRG